ncbi:MAG: hypothetical protein AAGG07_10955 [Planctomycetota bacterium]
MSDSAGIQTAALHEAQEAHGAKANPAILSVVFVLTIATVVLLVAMVWVYFNSYLANLRAEKMENTVSYQDYAAVRAQADSQLSTYGWTDTEAGLVHIPLDLAIDRFIQEENDG